MDASGNAGVTCRLTHVKGDVCQSTLLPEIPADPDTQDTIRPRHSEDNQTQTVRDHIGLRYTGTRPDQDTEGFHQTQTLRIPSDLDTQEYYQTETPRHRQTRCSAISEIPSDQETRGYHQTQTLTKESTYGRQDTQVLTNAD